MSEPTAAHEGGNGNGGPPPIRVTLTMQQDGTGFVIDGPWNAPIIFLGMLQTAVLVVGKKMGTLEPAPSSSIIQVPPGTRLG